MGFGDDFLAKRYAAGWKDGFKESFAKNFAIGRAEVRSELLKFLGENPGATVEEVKEWLRNRDTSRKGDEAGKERRSSRPPFCAGIPEESKEMGVGDELLAERYMSGWKDGFKESFAKNFAIGREEGREELLKFLGENPGATAKDVEEWARNRDTSRKGEDSGKERRSSRPPFCAGITEASKGMGVGDELLAERYMSGWKDGFKESFAKNFAIGREEGIEIGNDQLLKFL